MAAILSLILMTVAFVILINTRSGQFGYKNKVYPGKTTKADLEKIMGKPQQENVSENVTIYQYSSENQYRPNFVEIKNDTVSTVKEQVVNSQAVNLAEFINQFGQPESKIFTEKYGILAPGHIWLKPGIIVFGNEVKGEVVEVWYFEPQTLDQLLSTHPELLTKEHEGF